MVRQEHNVLVRLQMSFISFCSTIIVRWREGKGFLAVPTETLFRVGRSGDLKTASKRASPLNNISLEKNASEV